MLFELKHETLFEYSAPVTESYLEFRLSPVTDSCQRVLQHRCHVSPNRVVRHHLDHLGNTVTTFNILSAQDRIAVTFESLVETFKGLRRAGPLTGLLLHDSLSESARTRWSAEFLEYARQFEALRGDARDAAVTEIRQAIHHGFRYDTDATHSGSTINDLLRAQAGVCQDFSHLMIAVCRHIGIPARYVSGYVLTDSAATGAAASHAWIEYHDGENWCGVDPTHNVWVEEKHIRLGVGRDYDDVAPNRGLYRGASEEQVTVAVHLRAITPDELEQSSRRLFASSQIKGFATRQIRRPSTATILQQVSAAQQQQQQQGPDK